LDDTDEPPDARIVALHHPPSAYGLPTHFASSRWYSPDERCAWIIGNEFYGNLKITMRGLCSELAPDDEIFVHGCAMNINGLGIVLSGASGAGKTTLLAALRMQLRDSLFIINEDWGPLSLRTGTLRQVGEPYLHMKYPSVKALASHLDISPSLFPSENFRDDASDPRARLMISPKLIFDGQLAKEGRIDLFVVLMRDLTQGTAVRTLDPSDIGVISGGQYSIAYRRVERFLNGALILTDEARYQRQLRLHAKLLSGVPCVLVNNGGTPADAAKALLKAISNLQTAETTLP
jgi:hypothetical protein